jgi:hypothetical protein
MLEVNDADIVHLTRAIARLPEDIKVKAVARAMRRVTQTARKRLIDRQKPRLDLPPSVIRKLTTAHFNAGGNTQELIVRSGWIPLYKLGASQTRKGVTVKLRGSYRHAFLAQMASGHKGVFRRAPGSRMAGKNKEQIRELFGPNPAHDITNNPEVYQALVAEVVEEVLLPRFLHELGRILPGR